MTLYSYTINDDPETKVYLAAGLTIDTNRGPRAAINVAVGDYIPCAREPWCLVTAVDSVEV